MHAQAYYRQALEADPTHVNILSNYGLYLAEVRDIHEIQYLLVWVRGLQHSYWC
jgi:Tfp pilus assembly protein PilF